jgi:hypothetical protein
MTKGFYARLEQGLYLDTLSGHSRMETNARLVSWPMPFFWPIVAHRFPTEVLMKRVSRIGAGILRIEFARSFQEDTPRSISLRDGDYLMS